MRPTRWIPALVLGSAGLVLGWIGWRSPAPTEMPAATVGADGEVEVPLAVVGALAEGEVVRELAVEGMCCRGCTRKLYDALLAVPGVRRAAVDFERGRAQAAVSADLDVAVLEAALRFDKYSATAAR